MSFINLDEGQDSFLDIIANLVGVLIILVVVVGAQATTQLFSEDESVAVLESAKVTMEVDVEDDSAVEDRISNLESKLSKASSTATRLRSDRKRLEKEARNEKLLAQQLATQRHELLIQLERVAAQRDQRRKEVQQKLSSQQQQKLQLQSEKIQLVAQLESLEKTIDAVEATRVESSVETIDHYPNPIARTVFSNEVHFRLDRGRIAYVPMDELVEQMKGELRLKAEKLRRADGTRETIGPRDGFRLQYELGVVQPSESEDPRSRIVQFKRFTISPTSSLVGESFENALKDDSNFARRLSRMEASRTTISVWVYPNSYQEHALLKEWLYERGFQMASWPLGEGRPISGGPNGFRTSAQ